MMWRPAATPMAFHANQSDQILTRIEEASPPRKSQICRMKNKVKKLKDSWTRPSPSANERSWALVMRAMKWAPGVLVGIPRTPWFVSISAKIALFLKVCMISAVSIARAQCWQQEV